MANTKTDLNFQPPTQKHTLYMKDLLKINAK